ncbi:MAG: periplasmic heavy metal sensor [Acidobacteriota bacterium]|nr:periplasmic heavy metal sensor [Acidobacteriota bacterium]MDQ5871183.1 periplasmic heavy metal sensor [Acidobacteriota bacterium]
MKYTFAILLSLTLCAAAAAESPAQKDDPIGRNLFPPELVMSHQQQIGLEEDQRETIKKEIGKAQSKFLDLQFQMQRESERLIQLLQARSLEEARILAQADAVMRLETETKKTHLSLLIRIKNALTAEQQTKLMDIRRREEK